MPVAAHAGLPAVLLAGPPSGVPAVVLAMRPPRQGPRSSACRVPCPARSALTALCAPRDTNRPGYGGRSAVVLAGDRRGPPRRLATGRRYGRCAESAVPSADCDLGGRFARPAADTEVQQARQIYNSPNCPVTVLPSWHVTAIGIISAPPPDPPSTRSLVTHYCMSKISLCPGSNSGTGS